MLIIENENKVVDGLHTFRIRNRLSLEALKYIVFSNIEDLNKVQTVINSDIQNKALVLNINEKVELEYFVTSANNIVEDRENESVRR